MNRFSLKFNIKREGSQRCNFIRKLRGSWKKAPGKLFMIVLTVPISNSEKRAEIDFSDSRYLLKIGESKKGFLYFFDPEFTRCTHVSATLVRTLNSSIFEIRIASFLPPKKPSIELSFLERKLSSFTDAR